MMARVCFSSAPPAVGFGNKGLRGALTLEIARTFDLFRETTLFFFFPPEKPVEASNPRGLGLPYSVCRLMLGLGRLALVHKPAVRHVRGSCALK